MLRKCTRYIFLLLLALLIIPSSIYFNNPKENVNNTTNVDAQSISYIESSNTINASSDAGYVITNYDVNIDVAENNVLHIKETIDCYFNVSSHGIYRDIPYVNKVKRLDGSTNTYIAEISNISVNKMFTKSKSSGVLSLQIGSASQYVIGEQTYIISYDYDLGSDNTKKYDELYFNIIGDEWTTTIEQVTFTINMPKAFDASLLGFASGYTGSTTNNVTFSVDGNTITGSTISQLSAYQALTIRLELPEDYFVGERSTHVNIFVTIGFVVPILGLIISIAVFIYMRNKNRVVETVEFYPPEKINSLDMALIYKGQVDNKDVVSLIVYLASKGYIRIEDDLKLIKVKDYAGSNGNEAAFMSALFAGGDEIFLDTIKYSNFSSKVSAITSVTNSKLYKEPYFDNKLNIFKTILILIGCLAMLAPSLIMVYDQPEMLFVYLFPIVAMLIFVNLSKNNRLFFMIFCLFWGGMPLIGVIILTLQFGNMFLITNIFGIMSAIIIFVLSVKLMTRTEEGARLYAKIKGFRNFIRTAEKSRLEMLCAENHSYFYDIIPYAYVLGVSDVWIKNFESIALDSPDWYSSTNGSVFSVRICNSIFSTASRLSTPIHTTSYRSGSSSGGGGFSGGGSSGGGSGGGGGGRW